MEANLPQRRDKLLKRKKIVAAWIRERMIALAIENPAQLARRLGGVDRSLPRRWLDAERLPSEPHMARLMRLFGPPPGLEGHDLGPVVPQDERSEEGQTPGTPDASALAMAPHRLAALLEESLTKAGIHGPARAQALASAALHLASFLDDRGLPHGDLVRYAQFLLDSEPPDGEREGKSDADKP